MIRNVLLSLAAMVPLAEVFVSPNMITANPSARTPERSFSTVSLNIAKVSDHRQVVDAIHHAPRLRQSDLYLFQEVRHQKGKPSVAEETARSLGYSVAFAPAADGVYDQGLAIVSRYPLGNVRIKNLKSCDLRFRSRTRIAVAATVQTPWGDLQAWNVHLDTRINPAERLAQLQPVIDDAAGHDGPRLIGGDFNTNDLYWVGNLLPLPFGPAHGSAVRSAMSAKGFDTPFSPGLGTFKTFRRHLDWIYLSGLDSVAASVEPARFSDHNAVWVHARL
jgi:endonuclease/exonuclease/phosphatase (EEP) superfamily protein YafD